LFFGDGVVIKLGDEVIGSIGATGAPGAKLGQRNARYPPGVEHPRIDFVLWKPMIATLT
jgi:hypothetical protein